MTRPILLPNSPLYNLIPKQDVGKVRSFMLDAIQVSETSHLKSIFFAGCAVTYAAVDSVWFIGRANFRLITAVFYIGTPECENRLTGAGHDFCDAGKSLLFVAATTAYIFAALICPCRYSFQDPLSPAPPTEAALVPYIPAPPIDPKLVQFVADYMDRHFPNHPLTTLIHIPYQGSTLIVDTEDPELKGLLAAASPNRFLMCEGIKTVCTRLIHLDKINEHTLEPILEELGVFLRQEPSPVLPAPNESWVEFHDKEILQIACHLAEAKHLSLPEKLRRFFARREHLTKKMKYRHSLRQVWEKLSKEHDIPALRIQLDRLPPSPLRDTANTLLDTLNASKKFKTEKAAYQAFVDTLCKAGELLEDASDSTYHALFGAAFTARYTVDLWPFMQELVYFATGHTPIKALSLENFWDVFHLKNTLAHQFSPLQGGIAVADQKYQMLQGELGLFFNPSRESNTPHRLAILKLTDGRAIDFLRQSTPVAQTTNQGAAARLALLTLERHCDPNSAVVKMLDQISDQDTVITGDFKGFIRSADQPILHLVFEAKAKGHERSRWKARVALQNEHFFPLALVWDGPFFEGSGPFLTLATFGELKAELLNQIEKGEDFYAAAAIRPSREILDALFTEVHTLFFSGRETLAGREEYQAYLILCYAYFVLHLIKTHPLQYLSGGCKDFLDRGGVFAVAFSLLILMLLGKENDPQALEEVLINILAPPLMVKKKGVVPARAILLKYVLEALNQMSAGQKEAFRQGRFHGLFQSFEVPKPADQHAYPSANTAATFSEYQRFLQELPEVGLVALKPQTLKNLFPTKEALFKQVNRDQHHVTFKGTALKLSAEALEAELEKEGFSEEDSLKILSGCNQAIVEPLVAELRDRFMNPSLHIELIPDSSQPDSLLLNLILGKEGSIPVASLAVEQHYQIVEIVDGKEKKTVAKISGTLLIGDHRTGDAELYCRVVRSGS